MMTSAYWWFKYEKKYGKVAQPEAIRNYTKSIGFVDKLDMRQRKVVAKFSAMFYLLQPAFHVFYELMQPFNHIQTIESICDYNNC